MYILNQFIIDLLLDLYIPVVYIQRRLSIPGNCIYYDLSKLLMRPYQGLGGWERGHLFQGNKGQILSKSKLGNRENKKTLFFLFSENKWIQANLFQEFYPGGPH